jgi:hypothetical protein
MAKQKKPVPRKAAPQKRAPVTRQIEFGPIDFGQFDIGTVRGIRGGRPHFDLGAITRRPVGSHNDDPWHSDRQFIDHGHGDGHQDQHTDDPDYPDDAHADQGHADRHNDQHEDDPDYPDDGGHIDNYPFTDNPSYIDVGHDDSGHDDDAHNDNHADGFEDNPHSDGHDDGHADGHDDSEFGGITRGELQAALRRIQAIINQLIRTQQQTIDITELHLTDMSKKLYVKFEQVFTQMNEMDARIRGSQPPGDRDPKKPIR